MCFRKKGGGCFFLVCGFRVLVFGGWVVVLGVWVGFGWVWTVFCGSVFVFGGFCSQREGKGRKGVWECLFGCILGSERCLSRSIVVFCLFVCLFVCLFENACQVSLSWL